MSVSNLLFYYSYKKNVFKLPQVQVLRHHCNENWLPKTERDFFLLYFQLRHSTNLLIFSDGECNRKKKDNSGAAVAD